MSYIENKKVKPEEYNFIKERIDLAALIAFEYGILSQATGEYDDSMAVMIKIREAALNYDFVIVDPGEDWKPWDWWCIDTGKARNFAEQKAKEIHDEVTYENDADNSQDVAEEIAELLQRISKLERRLKEFKSILKSIENVNKEV